MARTNSGEIIVEEEEKGKDRGAIATAGSAEKEERGEVEEEALRGVVEERGEEFVDSVSGYM